MNYDPYHIDLDEITRIMHPAEAIQKMAETAAIRYRLRCKVFNISIEDQGEEYEELLTKIANSNEIELIKQETHFDKSGDYIVALHWKERVKTDENKSP
jgi:hypothetical protein